MSIFRRRKANDEPPKEVRRVFERMKRELEGHKLADEAISHRNLGNYEKALRLLKKALDEFDYTPAITLIGTTALMKGDVAAAIRWFSHSIALLQKQGNFPLIELYANLGSIYSNHIHDYQKALDTYQTGLNAPRPPACPQEAYALMVSNVHADMAAVHANIGDLPRARQYATRCLEVDSDSETAKAVIAFCQQHGF